WWRGPLGGSPEAAARAYYPLDSSTNNPLALNLHFSQDGQNRAPVTGNGPVCRAGERGARSAPARPGAGFPRARPRVSWPGVACLSSRAPAWTSPAGAQHGCSGITACLRQLVLQLCPAGAADAPAGGDLDSGVAGHGRAGQGALEVPLRESDFDSRELGRCASHDAYA